MQRSPPTDACDESDGIGATRSKRRVGLSGCWMASHVGSDYYNRRRVTRPGPLPCIVHRLRHSQGDTGSQDHERAHTVRHHYTASTPRKPHRCHHSRYHHTPSLNSQGRMRRCTVRRYIHYHRYRGRKSHHSHLDHIVDRHKRACRSSGRGRCRHRTQHHLDIDRISHRIRQGRTRHRRTRVYMAPVHRRQRRYSSALEDSFHRCHRTHPSHRACQYSPADRCRRTFQATCRSNPQCNLHTSRRSHRDHIACQGTAERRLTDTARRCRTLRLVHRYHNFLHSHRHHRPYRSN